MRHRRRTKYFGRKLSARTALLRGLVDSLVEHGRIRTTVAKAKELRRHVERAVTMGKKGDLHARRILLSRYPNQSTVQTLVNDLGVRFKDREGGYTRILKLAPRPGDMADMAYIEFVDHESVKSSESTGAAASGTDAVKSKGAKKTTKAASTKVAGRRTSQQKRKRLRRLQSEARAASRA